MLQPPDGMEKNIPQKKTKTENFTWLQTELTQYF